MGDWLKWSILYGGLHLILTKLQFCWNWWVGWEYLLCYLLKLEGENSENWVNGKNGTKFSKFRVQFMKLKVFG